VNPEASISTFVRDKLVTGSADGLTPDTDLVGSGMLDSTAMMELVVWVEEHFAIQVAVDDLVPENFGTIRKLATYVERCRAGAAPR
jgi:acyl carrier protein